MPAAVDEQTAKARTGWLQFEAFGRPIPQPRSRSKGSQRPYVTEDHPVQTWKKIVWAACHEQIVRKGYPKPCFVGDVYIRCVIRGAHHSADLDNLYKAITDALKGTAYKDDRQISHMEFIRAPVDEFEAGVFIRMSGEIAEILAGGG